jgi:hypothetical protein
VTGTRFQEHGESSRKRQRIDSDNDDRPSTIMKPRQKKPTSDREHLLICCFRGDSRTPCPGTDKSICEVIDKLASSHNVPICKTCYVLLTKSDSGENLHPDGVDCVEHCLSPRCVENLTTTVGQKHIFNAKSCGTKTGRPRPEDRESIYRYIFKLVHPAREVPANVFTTGKVPHLGVIPRQGSHRMTREELVARVEGLAKQLEELHRRDSLSATTIGTLTASNAHLRTKMQRLQDIIHDALQPGIITDDYWRRSLCRRANREAPDAMDDASSDSLQTLQTPHLSLRSTQPSAVPTPNDTSQYARPRDSVLQASDISYGVTLAPEPFLRAHGLSNFPDNPSMCGNNIATVSPLETAGIQGGPDTTLSLYGEQDWANTWPGFDEVL